jgi:hypothetical protein
LMTLSVYLSAEKIAKEEKEESKRKQERKC